MRVPVNVPVTHKKRILIADDNREFRESAIEYLEAKGYEVTAAGDGAKAWQNVRYEYPYYAIVLDINMPRMRYGRWTGRSTSSVSAERRLKAK